MLCRAFSVPHIPNRDKICRENFSPFQQLSDEQYFNLNNLNAHDQEDDDDAMILFLFLNDKIITVIQTSLTTELHIYIYILH